MTNQWRDLGKAFTELEAELGDVARGLTVRAFNGILSKTPQYLGRMTASWTYSIGVPEYVDRSSAVDSPDTSGSFTGLGYYQEGANPLWRGHPVAIGIANAANAGKDTAFRLGDKVYISNGVDHGEGPYSQGIEDGSIILRAENRPGAPVSRTIDSIGVMYQNVSPLRARSLKSLKIGQPDAS